MFRKALEYAAQLAQKLDCTLVLVNVVGQAPYMQTEVYDKKYRLLRMCEQILVEKQQQLKTRGITSEVVCIVDSPADKIVEISEKVEADAIVVGSRGLRGLKTLVLGSVSNAVAQKAKQTVIIVKGN